MRHFRLFGALLLLVGLVSFGLSGLVGAQSFRSGDDVTVPAGEAIDSTLYAAGRSIDIAGTVNGDVFCGGMTVTISGDVSGDVICAAQNLTISGTVAGDIRVAGQNVTLTGTVGHNATIGAQSYTASSKSRVGGDVSLGGQTATLNGMVGRDIVVGGGEVTINGTIGRRIKGEIDTLTLGSAAIIREGGSYTSRRAASIATGAQVGSLVHKQPKARAAHHGINWGWRVYFFIALLAAALVLVLLWPGLFQRTSQIAMERPLMTVLIGFIASVTMPVILIVLCCTVVGIPLALFLMLAWMVAGLASGAFASYYLGRLLLGRTKFKNAILYMLLGAAVLLVLRNIPYVNIISIFAALWFGLGMMVLYVKNHYVAPRYSVRG